MLMMLAGPAWRAMAVWEAKSQLAPGLAGPGSLGRKVPAASWALRGVHQEPSSADAPDAWLALPGEERSQLMLMMLAGPAFSCQTGSSGSQVPVPS